MNISRSSPILYTCSINIRLHIMRLCVVYILDARIYTKPAFILQVYHPVLDSVIRRSNIIKIIMFYKLKALTIRLIDELS